MSSVNAQALEALWKEVAAANRGVREQGHQASQAEQKKAKQVKENSRQAGGPANTGNLAKTVEKLERQVAHEIHQSGEQKAKLQKKLEGQIRLVGHLEDVIRAYIPRGENE